MPTTIQRGLSIWLMAIRVCSLLLVVSAVGAGVGMVSMNTTVTWGLGGLALLLTLLIGSYYTLMLQRQQQALLVLQQQLLERDHTVATIESRCGGLLDTVEELQASNEAKSLFLATMSHELRTPLTVVLSTVQMLQLGLFGVVTDEQQGALLEAELAGKQVFAMINDILDFSRLESGRLSLHFEPVQLGPMLGEAVRAIRGLAEQKGLQLIVEPVPEMQTEIITDTVRLRQIVFNLLSNAVKFTERGEIKVRVYPLPAERYAIEVRDTGVGIPPDKLSVVWEPFMQANHARLREHHGTGLGLGIVRHLTTMLGGTVLLESSLNQGTTFTLVFPTDAETATLGLVQTGAAE